ncbi:putative tail fiber protein [Bacteroides phage Barc2635]|nr:putative tail fiber protein [Bacteroides phage Barc2635]
MEVHNNFSPLAFRKKESKATYEKWYAFGKNYAIPASANTLTPFQFTELNIPVFDPNTIEVEIINEETGEAKKSGVYVSFDVMPEHGGVLYVSPGKNSFREALPQGTYRARFSIGDEVYISTPFCVIPGIETSSKYLLIEYWNDEKIAYPGGFITTGANNDFRYQMYVPATICKPKYEFEEELTKRAGYKFLELQTSTKVYAFTFVAPEFICDAMRLIRLSDYIRISHDGEYYNALNFEFDVDWQEQLYLAAVDCQFETDSIIQKLPSFNRRDKASFYNALLANIDTPIMFSPDTVGLYYKEYRETEPVVKGKLIRELSPIDLIDENTTIAVDLGTGEARKFNLYQMLQDYISKAHEDATDFLLHLRGGATFGDDISGSAAHINSAGDAKFNDVDADAVSADSVDVGSWLSVGNTAFTVSKSGKTNTGEFTARGKAYLTEDVYTGGGTGTITKDGQLKYLSAIIQQFLSSPTFVSGFLGEGFKIWVENGNWHIECDNLTVRQTMNIFDLLIQKIRSVNGALVVSQSNGKIKSVSEDETNYVITMEEEGETFQPNDLVRCQVWTGSKTKFYWVEVASVSGNFITVKKSEFTAGNKPEKGDEVVQMGNTQNAQRQALIYITAQESGHPYIEILNGVKTKSLSGTNRTRLGDLSNIQDSAFPEGQQPSGSGLYCDNAFLRGIFLLRNGKSVEDEVNQAKQDAANAATEAERAQQTAQEAKDRLNKWADDGFISPTEKPALIDEGKRIQAEFLQIKNNADKYGVSISEYTKAYEDYLNELRYHSAQQPEDIAVRPELAQSQTAYYDKRNGALNAIATATKSYVDEADKKLKEYLDTEITAIPGKIELAVRSLKTANYNLLLDSNHTLSANPYQLGVYRYETHLVVGKSYTLTVCYKCADSSSILAYNNAGGGHVAEFPKSDNETIVSVKISPFNEDLTYFEFYKLPQKETTQTYVKWAVITEGDIGVSNWIPSKSEMFSGGSNLVLNSGVCVDNYALFGLSKTYYELRGQDVVISFDYEYSNLVLGSNNRFGVETEVPLSTGGVQYFGAFVYVDSRSPSSGKGRYSYALKVSDNVVDNGLKHIQAYVQVGSGTVVKICNFQIEKGNTPTEWKPAPEDILNDSKKYTDTQILAVDGKIELSVKTKVENLGIGANNLYSYTSTALEHLNSPNITIERQLSLHGFYLVGKNPSSAGDSSMRIMHVIPPIPGKYTVSGWIKGSQSTPVGFIIDVCDSESYTVRSTADNQWSYFKHTFDVTRNTEAQSATYHFVDLESISWAHILVKDFKVEAGEIATAWSPNFQDAVYKGAEYTDSQISVVEGKITSTVEKINTVDGRVTGLASRVEQTEKSITSVVGDISVINSTTNRHISKRIDLRGWDDNKFFPLVISIPVYHKTRVEISRPLNAGYGKPSYGTHNGGFSMNLTFEMSGSGWGSLPAVTNIFDYTKAWTSAGAKIVVDLGQITETSTCRMGIRGGSMYDVTVDDTIDPNVINIYQTDYHGSHNTSFPVRTDGTEPVRTYGYYTEIKQTQESIALTANKVDDQGRRLSAAELTLSSDHAKLSVVEQTANSANSLAGTANSKANTVDGRVTATQNGLVETGINITSRKIVLKSDNVLFQNNAGQQTAAINANGKLTANAIEVGEVVAGGFAAQRITTGNLTVTDGAVIGGMTITGGVLTGKNINIQDGAKIGNFTIVSGIFSAQNTPAGIQMTLSNNAATFDSSGVRVEHNSGGYALTTTGNGRIFLTGSNFWVQCKDVDFMGAQTWKAPGVFYACTILGSGVIGATWGNPDFHITRVVLNSTGRYTVYTSGGQVGNYFVMVQGYDPSLWLSTTVEPYSAGQFTYKVFDVNTGLKNASVIIYFCGMVS